MGAMEFNTDEDVHTIMKYKQQESRMAGSCPTLVTVDLDSDYSRRLADACKVVTLIYLAEALKCR